MLSLRNADASDESNDSPTAVSPSGDGQPLGSSAGPGGVEKAAVLDPSNGALIKAGTTGSSSGAGGVTAAAAAAAKDSSNPWDDEDEGVNMLDDDDDALPPNPFTMPGGFTSTTTTTTTTSAPMWDFSSLHARNDDDDDGVADVDTNDDPASDRAAQDSDLGADLSQRMLEDFGDDDQGPVGAGHPGFGTPVQRDDEDMLEADAEGIVTVQAVGVPATEEHEEAPVAEVVLDEESKSVEGK